MRERERFASQERSDEGGTRSVAMIHRMTGDGTAGVPSTQPVLVREPTSAFSVRWGGSYCPLCSTPRNRGRSALRSTIIPFSESRYRSSDVGRAHLQTGEAHLFISAPPGDIAHYTLLRKVVRQARHLWRTKCGTHVLDGDTPYPVIRTKDSAYNGNLWRVPITAQSSTDATDHDALQPLRGAKRIVSARPSVNPSHHARNIGEAAGALRPKRWGGAPFSINEGRPSGLRPRL